MIAGNYYVITLSVFIAATACALVLLPVASGLRVGARSRPPSRMSCRRHARPTSPGRASRIEIIDVD